MLVAHHHHRASCSSPMTCDDVPTGAAVEYLHGSTWTEAVVVHDNFERKWTSKYAPPALKLRVAGRRSPIEVQATCIRPRHVGFTWPPLCRFQSGVQVVLVKKTNSTWTEVARTLPEKDDKKCEDYYPSPRILAKTAQTHEKLSRMHPSGAGRCFEHMCMAAEEASTETLRAWLAYAPVLAIARDSAGFTLAHYVAAPSPNVTIGDADARVECARELARLGVWQSTTPSPLVGGTQTTADRDAQRTPLFLAVANGLKKLARVIVADFGGTLSEEEKDELKKLAESTKDASASALRLDALAEVVRHSRSEERGKEVTAAPNDCLTRAMSLAEVCEATGRQPTESQRFDQTLCPDVFETVNLWRQWRRRQKKGRMTRHDISWHDTPGKLTDIGLGDGRKVSEHTGVIICELPMDDPARVYAASLYANERQFGVFASREIGCGEILGEYGGLVRTEDSVHDNVFTKPRIAENVLVCAKTSHTYDHDLNFANASWAEGVTVEMQVDARVFCSTMAFVNDFRTDPLEFGAASSSRSPNAAYEAVLDAEFWPRILVVATKTILPGEQVLADYGEGFWNLLRGFVHDRDEVERCIMDAAAVNKEAPPPPPLPPPLPPPPLPLPLPAPAAPRSPSVHVVDVDDDDDDEPLLLEFAPPLVEDLTSPSLVEDLTGPSLVEDLTGSPPAAEDLTHQVLVIE